MAWSPDPELHRMFLDELDQRTGRLASGAKALVSGDASSVDLTAMHREGHTIKGTARVMGYEAVAIGGVVLEAVWDGIAAGDVEPTASVGEALVDLCEALREAGRADAGAGTPGLVSALEAIGSEVPGVELPALPAFPERPPAGEEIAEGEGSGAAQNVELIPPVRLQADDHARPSGTTAPSVSASRGETGSNSDTPPAPAGAQLDQPVSRREPPDIPAEYGGMIGAVESWASEGTVVVNAGRLYRLINRIAATRTEAAALSEMVASGARRQPEPNGFRGMVDGLALATEALQSDVLGLASLPLSTLTGHLPQLVGYLAKKLGKNVELEITGDVGIVIDRHVVEAISEPVRQLIVNAIYHGLEIPTRHKSERKPSVGSLKVDVALEGNMVELVVADDGEGVDWGSVHETAVELRMLEAKAPADEETLLPLLFEPGFTTGAIDGGGRDGLSRIAAAVEALHGRVHFETWPGDGDTGHGQNSCVAGSPEGPHRVGRWHALGHSGVCG